MCRTDFLEIKKIYKTRSSHPV